jgi:hypothetical protein
MRPDGHGQEGTWTDPLRDLGTTLSPRGLKERTGGVHPSAETLRPWGSIDSSKRQVGAPLRRLCPGMRPHGLRDQLKGVQRSTSKAADVAVFPTVIDGESRTRAPRRHASVPTKRSASRWWTAACTSGRRFDDCQSSTRDRGRRRDRPRSAIHGLPRNQARSKRSRFITFVHAATKSRTNFSCASELP